MKKRKILKSWLTLAFLAVSVISCSNSSSPKKPAEEDETPPAEAEEPELPYKKVDTKTINGKSYDIVTFGSFPQTMKAASVTINESETKPDEVITYYKGSDGQWYAEYEYQINADEYHGYCKKEPIKWRVLTDNFDHDNDSSTPGLKLLLAENILDNISFYDSPDMNRTIENTTIYPKDYKHSAIRAYLNGLTYILKTNGRPNVETEVTYFSGKGFLQMAFTADEQKYIQRSGATEDKLFLLSQVEISTAAYGFSEDDARIKKTTDYANPNEAGQNLSNYWWLRSSSEEDTNQIDIVDLNGSLDWAEVDGDFTEQSINSYWGGVVPALCIF